MSDVDLTRSRTAMSDPEHMKRWLRDTGRTYIVLRTDQLVDSLSWPRGVEAFMGIIDAYRSHRSEQMVTLPNGTVRGKTELPEPDEIDAAIDWLNNQKG